LRDNLGGVYIDSHPMSIDRIKAGHDKPSAAPFLDSFLLNMASPNTYLDPLSVNSQQPTISAAASSQSQFQSRTADSQSQPSAGSSRTSLWGSIKVKKYLSKKDKDKGSVLKTKHFDSHERWVELKGAGTSFSTDVPEAFLKAYERIIQQEEVCSKIISQVDISGNVSNSGDNYRLAWQPEGRSWKGSVKQGSWESDTFKIDKKDHGALTERLGKGQELASRLSVDGKIILVVFAGVNPLDGEETGYRFSFRLYPITRQNGLPSAQTYPVYT
jgi:hypothetical protein